MGAGSERAIERDKVSVTIASGASLSGAVNVAGYLVVGITVPAEFDGTAITFQVSSDGSTYVDAYDAAGTELNVGASASRYIALGSDTFAGVEFVKVRAGTSASPTNQTTTDSVLTLHLRRQA